MLFRSLKNGDFLYNIEETTQTGRIYDDGEFGKSAETNGHARRRTERSPPSQGINTADITVVGTFGHQCDSTPPTIERVWRFLHEQGQLIRMQGLLALQLIRVGTLRTLVSMYKKNPALRKFLTHSLTIWGGALLLILRNTFLHSQLKRARTDLMRHSGSNGCIGSSAPNTTEV